ncbi:OmpA family protein [Spirosoma spitsbergense]|uniref:OmpA family protein n=1 Tax=Spirosoma spitsbergense TaxID=431554 RepID=UPI0003816C91|nr:OmpA family protein [Spirosoma spitsbergense]
MCTGIPCLRLTGVVQDYASHLPLMANFYVETQQGRSSLGVSAAPTGQFTIDISCTATALIIEKAGYRTQTLLLNQLASRPNKSVGVIIPLIAVDKRGLDRPYFQSEQTHFVQKNSKQSSIRPQRNTFVITDALTGQLLPAEMCFTFTKTELKRCMETNRSGQVRIDFTEKDIVAIDVTSPGYQNYGGNQVVEQGDSRQLRHDIRLSRTLTILSLQIGPSVGNCELRSENDAGKVIGLQSVPGLANTLVAYDLLPQRYTLLITNKQRELREQRPIVIQPGLNTATSELAQPVADGATLMSRPDSALRFEQASYTLLQDSQALLTQVAAYLVQHPELAIIITGHTDKEGNERLNLNLSEYRAKVVSSFLRNRGVTDDRIEMIGLGSQLMVAPSDTEENKAKNRRVTIKFIPRKTP